ncbi:uncharacterized protein LOC119662502 [Teleopsis dalmanni]|uniref:uncharacterized protein LOC119662502 n=1 Tax=Teleopsis dalmanni TaxID=139649 RepID=UPI0018CC8CE0|nr:uncharacterized protein LOC119662502 [Teleopsis dalmanni]
MEKCVKISMKDFIQFAKNTESLNQLFPNNVKHRQLAHLWLLKLCNYSCKNIEDHRVRNRYMRNLLACISKRTLFGCFLIRPPLGKLRPTNFYINHYVDEESDERIEVSQGETIADINELLEQKKNLLIECCCMSCSNQPKKYNSPSINKSGIPRIINLKNKNTGASKAARNLCPMWKVNVKNLLGEIAAELKGEIKEENKAHLERQLERYRNFIKNYTDMNALLNEQSISSQRSFLLVHFQKDLIRLLRCED